jgi:hypothetical protein
MSSSSSKATVHQSHKAPSISSSYSKTSGSSSGGYSGSYGSYDSYGAGVYRDSNSEGYETVSYPSHGKTIIDYGKRVYDSSSPSASYRGKY